MIGSVDFKRRLSVLSGQPCVFTIAQRIFYSDVIVRMACLSQHLKTFCHSVLPLMPKLSETSPFFTNPHRVRAYHGFASLLRYGGDAAINVESTLLRMIRSCEQSSL
jgi:hypothetical protein